MRVTAGQPSSRVCRKLWVPNLGSGTHRTGRDGTMQKNCCCTPTYCRSIDVIRGGSQTDCSGCQRIDDQGRPSACLTPKSPTRKRAWADAVFGAHLKRADAATVPCEHSFRDPGIAVKLHAGRPTREGGGKERRARFVVRAGQWGKWCSNF